jgi:ubiquinone/menaquinone biosynthesis C-methylase UbiE
MIPTSDIYSSEFIKSLFDEMSATYGVTNLVSSFGFCKLWRDQCVAAAGISQVDTVIDLMSGMGECWSTINRKLKGSGKIIGIDFSAKMCEGSERALHKGFAVLPSRYLNGMYSITPLLPQEQTGSSVHSVLRR